MHRSLGRCALGSTLLLTMAAVSPTAASAQWSPSRPDSHAPIGVMGDHRHHAGEVMLSYRYGYMSMEGNRDGTEPVSEAQIVSPEEYGYMVAPTEMSMQMHMLGAMYAPSDRVTLMGMFPYVVKSMDHVTRAGGTFTTESQGVGDLTLGALIGLADWAQQSLHLNALVGIPTGSITERDVLPTSDGQAVQLPYPMQIGSGTFDLRPGLTWLGQTGNWSWGAQGGATIRLGENDRGWTLGNRYGGTAWWARTLGRHFSASVRLLASHVENVSGADPAPSVNPAVVPTAEPGLRAGTTVESGFGVNYYLPPAKAFRLAAELLLPLYRNLDGPQLEMDWRLVLGVQIVPIK
jgi:hypothetical protein